jgi:competence ComEA-like helix-hairpin-helix protein
MRREASVLVGVLWCLALLSVVVISGLHASRLDLAVGKNYGDQIQAHYLALAGIEKAKALLFRDAAQRRQSRINHTGQLYDDPTDFRDVPLGRGRFSVLHRQTDDAGSRLVYGIGDEESRLNVNHASPAELSKLYGMTPDIVAAIADWRDRDNQVTPGGAEADYYASLNPPSQPRNGPFQTVGELLMVRGVTPRLLLGPGSASGLPRASDYGEAYPALAPVPGEIAANGWARVLTVASGIRNVNAAGKDRVNVKSADEGTLTSIRGISPPIAKAIIAYRGKKQLQSLGDLLDVPAAPPPGRNPAAQPPVGQPPGSPPNLSVAEPTLRSPNPSTGAPTGPPVISEDLLTEIADDLTSESGEELPGVININTAGQEVLACLPGVDAQLARAIVAYRQSDGFFPNIACLLKVQGMTHAIFKQVAGQVCARSETFRILSEGRVASTGARQSIQVIVRIGPDTIDTLCYRERL